MLRSALAIKTRCLVEVGQDKVRPRLQLQIDELTAQCGQVVVVVGGWIRHQAVGPSPAPHELGVAQAPSAEISRYGLAGSPRAFHFRAAKGNKYLGTQAGSALRLARGNPTSPPKQSAVRPSTFDSLLRSVYCRLFEACAQDGGVYKREHISITPLSLQAYST